MSFLFKNTISLIFIMLVIIGSSNQAIAQDSLSVQNNAIAQLQGINDNLQLALKNLIENQNRIRTTIEETKKTYSETKQLVKNHSVEQAEIPKQKAILDSLKNLKLEEEILVELHKKRTKLEKENELLDSKITNLQQVTTDLKKELDQENKAYIQQKTNLESEQAKTQEVQNALTKLDNLIENKIETSNTALKENLEQLSLNTEQLNYAAAKENITQIRKVLILPFYQNTNTDIAKDIRDYEQILRSFQIGENTLKEKYSSSKTRSALQQLQSLKSNAKFVNDESLNTAAQKLTKLLKNYCSINNQAMEKIDMIIGGFYKEDATFIGEIAKYPYLYNLIVSPQGSTNRISQNPLSSQTNCND